MRKTNKHYSWGLTLMVFMGMSISCLFAQIDVKSLISYPFDSDSLYGFNEEAVLKEALSKRLEGFELKAYIAMSKRKFIDKKYNIQPSLSPIIQEEKQWNNIRTTSNILPPSLLSTSCNNSDFESGAFSPWQGSYGSTSGADNCSMSGCCPTSGNSYNTLLSTPFNDPNIPSLTIPNSPFGGNIIARVNNTGPGDWTTSALEYSMNVTPNNALFQIAYIAVLESGGHCGNEQPTFLITFYVDNTCTGTAFTPTTCPQINVIAPPACAPYCGTSTFTNYATSGSYYYNTSWQQISVDLTPFLNKCVKIRFAAADCIYGGHVGYVYLDAICSPMDITTDNGAVVNTYPAGSPTITASMCGYSSATLTAPPGLGPYQWQGPAGFPTQTTQAVVTNITGNYTLTMNPPGACSPITRTITVVNTPAPALQVTPVQPSCTNSVAVVSATASLGSGSFSISWSPPPASTTQISANTFSASGLIPGSNTVTVRDSVGCTATQVFTINAAAVIPTFSISLSDDTLTCNQPTVTASAVSTNSNAVANYTFTSVSSGAFAGNPYTVSMPGTYTVFAQDANSGCIYTQTFVVGNYTTVPSVTVTPNTLNIPCIGSAGTFTGTSTPTTNITYQWLQPGGSPVSGNLLTPGVAGTYTFVATNIANGCSNTFTVAVTQSTAAPTMTVSAINNNYNIKCSPNTVTLVVNATQAQNGGVPIPYWTDATGSSTLSTFNTFTTNTPGNYVCVVYDPVPGGCIVSQTITVGMDTLKPVGGYTLNVPTNTLSCKYPSAVLTGTSSVSGATYIWYTPGTVPNQTLAVNSTTNISQTTVGTYTVEITDPNNGCKRKVPVTIYQDKQPLGLTAKATPTALTCKDLQTTLQFTPNPISDPLTYTWTTPPPTFSNTSNNPVTFYTAGTYTLCTTRLSNGCQSCTTVLVGSNTTPPATTAVGPYTIACGYTNTTIYAGVTPSTNLTYVWDGPPGATITPVNGYSPTVTNAGNYLVVVTNTTTGCAAQNYVTVVNGTINADFTPNPSDGFAPLNVSFTNNSTFGNPTNLSYYWSFGNGGTITAVANPTVPTPGAFTTYNSPGTYTVVMIMKNGPCIDTAMRIIRVDVPSDMEVPNIFTPNGDGVNDYFIIHATNLTEIQCIIFDRWGVEMYNVTTDKGNIQWDGKTKGGKDAPAGTYFYTIKAKGKDDKTYEKQGYITLIR